VATAQHSDTQCQVCNVCAGREKLVIRIAESYKSTASLQRMKHVSQIGRVATWLDVIAPKLAEKEKEISQQNVDPFDIACDNRNCQQLNFCHSFDKLLKSLLFSDR